MVGGGIYKYQSSPVLTNVTISGNQANTSGGGIYKVSCSPVLTNVSISDNTGEGMYNYVNSCPVLTNVTISGNSNRGIYNNANSSPVLTNVAIFGNTTGEAFGGGMFNKDNSKPVLTNVTISGNSATGNTGSMTGGGGIYNYNDSFPQIRNSIIWGNTAEVGSANIGNGAGGNPAITYSIVGGGGYPTDGSVDGDGNKDVDPLFVDLKDPATYSPMPNSDGDYSLISGSPAIDAGDNDLYPDADAIQGLLPPSVTLSDTAKTAINAALPYDLGGTDREKGGAIDMGAYEKE
jgi:predicted outer membrane repeat protein